MHTTTNTQRKNWDWIALYAKLRREEELIWKTHYETQRKISLVLSPKIRENLKIKLKQLDSEAALVKEQILALISSNSLH